MSGFVVWMTGLSGAGKSTLASMLTQELSERGVHVECLDGDEVRKNLSHGLGFAREDRDRNIRRIGYVARMVARSGACAITAAISPYRALRDEIRSRTENFIEVYCECPIDVLTERDPKGLYKRALAGELKNFTGVSDPYEAPEDPEVHLRTDQTTPEQCIAIIVDELERRGLLTTGRRSALPAPFGGEVFEARRLHENESAPVQIPITEEIAAEVALVARGLLSPLSGFMTEREAVKVRKNSALERGTPWWNEPFVCPVPADCQLEEGQKVALTVAGRVVAIAIAEHLWRDAEQGYLAGPLEASAREEGALTARELRRRGTESSHGYICAVFALAAPSPTALIELRAARQVTDQITLFVPAASVSTWRDALGREQGCCPLVAVPSRVPLSSERAQAVLAKSLGATATLVLSQA